MAQMIRSAAHAIDAEVSRVPSPLQEYGDQFSRTAKRRRAQRDLIAARNEAERNAEMARAATVTAEGMNRTKTEFLANMSHKLRTPINAIIGFAEVIESGILGTAQTKQKGVDYGCDINAAGNHLLEVINEILDIAQIEAGKLGLDEEIFDVDKSLCACLNMLAEQSQKKGVQLKRTSQGSLPDLRGDKRKFKQIVINLLSNAIKFTPEGGKVSLGAEINANGGLKVTISDTGIGIAAEDLDKVLEPFAQVKSAHARKYEGTGLGLPISKAYVELHGGSFTMKSKLGVGTSATIQFPADRVEHASNDPQNLNSAHEIVG